MESPEGANEPVRDGNEPMRDEEEGARATRALLARLGAAMAATGQPTHEIEEELVEAGARLGYPRIQVGVAPTGLHLALHSGEPATYESVGPALRLDQAGEVRRLRHELTVGELDPAAAFEQLAALPERPERYPRWSRLPAWIGVSLGIALILQPAWANAALAAGCSVVVHALLSLGRRTRSLAALVPTVAAFAVAAIVFAVAGAGWIEGPLRTVLPALAPLLPGALIVTGMSELAAGHMQAGASRLIYGIVQLGLFAVGLIAATAVLDVPAELMGNVRVADIGWAAAPAGLLLIAFGICFVESVELSTTPWVLLVLLVAFAAQWSGNALGSAALGGFLGAIAASVTATLVERIRPRSARFVLFLPAFWLLVPGSLGLVGVTALVADPARAAESVLGVLAVICAIALGLLVGSSVGLALRRRTRIHVP